MAKHRGLYKRGEVWWLYYAGPDGRKRRESAKTSSFKDAQDKLVLRKKEVQEGKDPTATKRIKACTFNQLSVHYLVWAERQKGYRQKKGFIKQLKKVFGNLPLRSFNIRFIEEWQTKRLVINKPSTVNRLLGTLKHMFTKAVDWDMVEEETLKKVRRVKLLPENNRRLRYLSKEECQEIIHICELSKHQKHLKPIIVTALNTGMRKEEILSLEWDKHIDLRHGFILLDKTKNNERREVPINQAVRSALQGIVRRLDSPYVFTGKNGRRYQDVKHSFKTVLSKAKIKDFRFHDLRHTFASQLIMAGVDLTTVKELLGHKDVRMTLRYAHLAPAHKLKAVEILDKALGNEFSSQKII